MGVFRGHGGITFKKGVCEWVIIWWRLGRGDGFGEGMEVDLNDMWLRQSWDIRVIEMVALERPDGGGGLNELQSSPSRERTVRPKRYGKLIPPTLTSIAVTDVLGQTGDTIDP